MMFLLAKYLVYHYEIVVGIINTARKDIGFCNANLHRQLKKCALQYK